MRTVAIALLTALVACKPDTLAEGRDGIEVVFRDATASEVSSFMLPSRRSVRRRFLGDQGRQSGAVRYEDGGAFVLGTTGRVARTPLAPTLTCDAILYALHVSFVPTDGVRLALGENLLEVVEGGTVLGVWEWEGNVEAGSATLMNPQLEGCTSEGSIDVAWSFDPDQIDTVPRPGTRPADAARDQPSSSRSIDF